MVDKHEDSPAEFGVADALGPGAPGRPAVLPPLEVKRTEMPEVAYENLRQEHAARRLATTMMSRPLAISDVLNRAETLFPEVELVSRHGPGVVARTTLGELALQARRLGAVMQGLGIRPGDRVATLMWNHAAHLTAYFAVPGIRAVMHTLNPRLSPQELAYIIADAGDTALLIDDDLLPLWREVEKLVQIPHVIVHALGDRATTRGPALDGCLIWQDVLAAAQPLADWPTEGLDENEAVSICYTSGTTGRPKGVVYSHRSVLLHSITAALPDSLGLSGRDTVLTMTPMFHVNAWAVPYSAVMLGARQVFAGPRPAPAETLDLLCGEGVTAALGVPTIWTDVLAAIDAAPQRWTLKPGIRFFSGGSAPPPDMFRRFDRLGAHLKSGWGMTETSPLGTQTWLKPKFDALDDEAQLQVRTTIGLPLPLVELRHVDAEDRPLPRDGIASGELQARGPWVSHGYIGWPEPLQATTQDGWFRTGDVVVIRPDGYIKLVDRQKDLVKSGGEWISSIDMEKALCDHPAVAEAAVIAVPDERWGERPLALLVLRAGTTATAKEVQAHLHQRFPKWMVPDQIEFLPELPRTGVGKVNKLGLRQTWGAKR